MKEILPLLIIYSFTNINNESIRSYLNLYNIYYEFVYFSLRKAIVVRLINVLSYDFLSQQKCLEATVASVNQGPYSHILEVQKLTPDGNVGETDNHDTV